VDETGCRDPLEARQRRLHIAAHGARDDVEVELGAHDRGDIDDGEVGFRQERIPPGEHRVQRRGGVATAARDLDDEQRVAAGLVGHRRRVGGGPEPSEEVGDLGGQQTAEVEVVDRRHTGEVAEQHPEVVIDIGGSVAGGDQRQDRSVCRRAGDVTHRRACRCAGEVEILDDEQEGTFVGGSPEVATDGGCDRRLP
jgi:hypothetical protein